MRAPGLPEGDGGRWQDAEWSDNQRAEQGTGHGAERDEGGVSTACSWRHSGPSQRLQDVLLPVAAFTLSLEDVREPVSLEGFPPAYRYCGVFAAAHWRTSRHGVLHASDALMSLV